jgi:hypothetical protein
MAGQAIRAMLKRLLQNAQQPGAPIGQQGSRLTKAPAAGASLVGQRPKPSLSRQAPGAGVSQQQQLDNEVQYRNLLAAAPDVDVPREIEGKLSFEDKLAQEVEREKQLGAVRTGYAKTLRDTMTPAQQLAAQRAAEASARGEAELGLKMQGIEKKEQKAIEKRDEDYANFLAIAEEQYPDLTFEEHRNMAMRMQDAGRDPKDVRKRYAAQAKEQKKLEADAKKQEAAAAKEENRLGLAREKEKRLSSKEPKPKKAFKLSGPVGLKAKESLDRWNSGTQDERNKIAEMAIIAYNEDRTDQDAIDVMRELGIRLPESNEPAWYNPVGLGNRILGRPSL